MQRFKWVLVVSVPIWFGYGFARDPDNLEWVKKVVRCCELLLVVWRGVLWCPGLDVRWQTRSSCIRRWDHFSSAKHSHPSV